MRGGQLLTFKKFHKITAKEKAFNLKKRKCWKIDYWKKEGAKRTLMEPYTGLEVLK